MHTWGIETHCRIMYLKDFLPEYVYRTRKRGHLGSKVKVHVCTEILTLMIMLSDSVKDQINHAIKALL